MHYRVVASMNYSIKLIKFLLFDYPCDILCISIQVSLVLLVVLSPPFNHISEEFLDNLFSPLC